MKLDELFKSIKTDVNLVTRDERRQSLSNLINLKNRNSIFVYCLYKSVSNDALKAGKDLLFYGYTASHVSEETVGKRLELVKRWSDRICRWWAIE